MALAAEVLGDRWMLLILREAFFGVSRYDDMRADLDASRSILTERLNRLVSLGLLERRSYREAGSRMREAYVLTEAGLDAAPILLALTAWGEKHVLGGAAPVALVDRKTGKSLRLALVDRNGREARLTDAALVLRK